MRVQALLLSFFLVLQLSAQSTKAPAKKAVFILLDGVSADALEKVNTPTIDEIAKAGGYQRSYQGGERGAYSETPTISAPGYMNLLTGVWGYKHNVWDNYKQSPNYHYWNLFRIVENANPKLKTAIFSTWLDNRTILIGEGKPNSGGLKLDYAFDGFELDTACFPHDKQALYISHIDNLVAEEAGRYIAEQGPDLSWVYLEYTDDAGHRYGDSEIYNEAIRDADAQVKKIWDAVKKRQATYPEDWMIVVTTDHGRDSLTGRGHGGQSLRERTTWIATNAQDLNKRFTEGHPPVIDIAPTILKHLGIAPPKTVLSEMDGTAFTGELSFDQLRTWMQGDTLCARWRPFHSRGKAELKVAFGNGYKSGQVDTYFSLAKVPLARGQLKIKLTEQQMGLFRQEKLIKVLLSAPLNQGNYWVVPIQTIPPLTR